MALEGTLGDPSPLPSSEQAIDLTGSRDFLTKETTEETLKSMLADGAVISKVLPDPQFKLSLNII